MVFYLLQENGSKILLEDGTGAILLELQGVGPTVFYQGGAGHPVKKRRRRTDELFAKLEAAVRAALSPPVVQVEAVVDGAIAVPQPEIGQHLAELSALAQGYADLQERLTILRYDLAQWEKARQRQIQDDEEEAFLMML